MTIEDIILESGGTIVTALGVAVVAVLGIIEVSPIKINPWSAIAKAIGRAVNADLLDEVKSTNKALEEHIADDKARQAADDEYKAEAHRADILAFNTSLLRGELHTQEDFFDAFRHIDRYENYCQSHPGYKNNRATHAIANIGRVYDERLKARDFLGGVTHDD